MLLSQGAEARIFIEDYNGTSCLVKERFAKKYRHPELDNQITKERIRAESKAIKRCSDAGILVPKIFNVNLESRKIFMEYFAYSITSKEYINKNLSELSPDKTKLKKFCEEIGKIIGKLHENNIIHGDLTTSNFLINPKSENEFSEYEIIIIDFGLSHYSHSVEDKAVDIYVLERALISTHSEYTDMFDLILKSYKTYNTKLSTDVIMKFEEVRARGRKRTMIG